eukprot:CFRG5710T1
MTMKTSYEDIALMEDLFGSESGGCIDEDPAFIDIHHHEQINGLVHVHGYLDPDEQAYLWECVLAEGWFDDPINNQAMRFGDLPSWASELVTNIHITAEKNRLLPADVLHRTPLFAQMIVNSYAVGDGIKAHVDLARFTDGIAVVSLGVACDMQFSRMANPKGEAEYVRIENINTNAEKDVTRASNDMQETIQDINNRAFLQVVEIRLVPGDLLLLSGDARYHWMHGIEKVSEGRRISLTLRSIREDSRTLTIQ